jgi:hypothetical protein
MVTRLHYLYEYDQRGGGKERFVYFCSNCNCVLRVRRDLGPTGETLDSVNGRCFGCGRSLERSIECRLTAVPDEWSDVYLTVPKAVEKRASDFRPASSFPHFSLGFPRLDSLLRPFAPGFVAAITGSEASVVAELAAFRAQLPIEAGGLDSTVVFIDGGNRSDPYLFSSFARQYGIKPNVAMRRIASCRVFTMYQLADLVSEHLLQATTDYAARLVVISDILGTFNEPELDEREARRLLCSVEEAIRRVKKDALVLVTLVSPSKYDDLVVSWADTVVSLGSSGGKVRTELLKHPSKPHTISSFRLSQLLMPRATR